MNLFRDSRFVGSHSGISQSQSTKAVTSILLILSSILLFALRAQQGRIVIVLWFLLGIISILSRSRVAMIGVTIFSLLLYVGPQMGWLYGRDTHSVALVAKHIISDGFPIPNSVLLTWSAPYTPGIHFHIAITSLISGLPLMPSTQPRILATALVPLAYTVTILIFSFLFARRLIPDFKPHYFLAVIFWTSIFYRKTVPRRHSLGFVFFIILLYIGWQVANTNDSRSKPMIALFVLVASSLAITHHFLSVTALLFLTGIALVANLRLLWTLLPLQGLIISLWFVFTGFVPFVVVVGLLSFGTPETVEYSNRILPTTLSSIRFGMWFIYAGLLAIPMVFVGLQRIYHRTILNTQSRFVLVIGMLTATLSITVWLSGLVAPDRILAIYVLAGGSYAVFCTHRVSRRAGDVLLCLLLVSGMALVPLHVVSSQPPMYHHLEDTQRHSEMGYASADWLAHGEGVVIADANMHELITPIAQRQTYARPEVINSGSVPVEKTVVLQQSDAERYFGTTPIGMVSIDPVRLWDRYNTNGERVYDNGDVRVYTRR